MEGVQVVRCMQRGHGWLSLGHRGPSGLAEPGSRRGLAGAEVAPGEGGLSELAWEEARCESEGCEPNDPVSFKSGRETRGSGLTSGFW